MKILCDVCCKKEASVFCSADEAALCDGCDQSIHHANKLASKHQRFSLLQFSSSHSPLCDICQEKRAILFCQQDRAILCRDCEIPIHTANEHTKKHNRFLLTGIKLSSTMIISDTRKKDGTTIISNEGDTDTVPNFKCTKDPTSSEFSENSNPKSATASVVTNNSNNTTVSSANNNQLINGGSTSNISEYLIDMLPGWHFEELLADSDSPAAFDFSKSGNKFHDFEVNEDVLSFFDVEKDDRDLTSSLAHQSENFWVPQAAPVITAGISNVFGHQSSGIHHSYTTGLVHGTKQQTNVSTMKMNRKCLKDDNFAVPQITSSVGSKRNRPFW